MNAAIVDALLLVINEPHPALIALMEPNLNPNRILRLPDDVLERLLAGYKDRINLPLKERRAQWNKELGEALREHGVEAPFSDVISPSKS